MNKPVPNLASKAKNPLQTRDLMATSLTLAILAIIKSGLWSHPKEILLKQIFKTSQVFGKLNFEPPFL